MLAHEALRERQSQPRAALAPAHQRIEDALGELLGHARAVVLDRDGDGVPVAAARDGHLARHARFKEDLARARRPLRALAPAVEDALNHLPLLPPPFAKPL